MSEKEEISKALDAETDSTSGSAQTPRETEPQANGQDSKAASEEVVQDDSAVSEDGLTEISPASEIPAEETNAGLEQSSDSNPSYDKNLEEPQVIQEQPSDQSQEAAPAQNEVEPQAQQPQGMGSSSELDQSPAQTTPEEPAEATETAAKAEVTDQTPEQKSVVETPDVTSENIVSPTEDHTEQPSNQAQSPENESVADKPDAEESPENQQVDAEGDEGSTADPASETVKEELPWEQLDFSSLDKAGLVAQIELMAKHTDPIGAERASKDLKPHFYTIQREQKQQALEAFKAEGNDPDGFAYRFDELDNRFDAAFKLLRDRKVQRIKEFERDKEKNLEEKNQLLEELRALVEAEETNASINALKKIQDRWRSLGPVPPQHAKTLWANYHALLDLYYDHRSIYYELKELDRKKNLTAKLELCDKAEKLVDHENLKEAISELNELHDEFKHIGPVPKEDQEALWQRFKGASDQIYARRKEFVKHLKEDLKENLQKKLVLAEEVQEYGGFASDRISDWNKKTQALLELQKRWDAIGGLPRDQAKVVNRKFWGSFKGFFKNKGQFFKQLEGERETNLEKKQALVAEAEALKESTDWNGTANKLKNLQKQWREIGPVPEKFRNSIYVQFKEACDQFFNNKRAQGQEIEKEYIDNLQKKQDVCTQIETMITAKDFDLEKFKSLNEDFDKIGYVPGSEVRNIRNQFKSSVDAFLAAAPEEVRSEVQQLRDTMEFEKLKSGPNANRRINQKEQTLRREIQTLENDISTWKNNLEFFAASKTADKLREEFTGKIDEASQQLKELKRQLRAVRQL